MRKNYITITNLLFFFILIFNGCGESFNMPTKRKPLSGEWLKAIKLKPDEFTAYVAQHPMKLKNVILKEESISKSTINGAEFINTDWDDSFAQNATIINTTFKDSDIYDTSFAESTLTNVVFDSVNLEKAEFVGAKLINVTFKNCKIYNSNFGSLKMSKILIKDSELNNVEFYESEVDITLKNVNIIEQGRFMKLKSGSKVTIEDSFIGRESMFDFSKLISFKMKNSTVVDSKMNDATVDEIVIENTKMDFPIANCKCNIARFNGVDRIILGRSKFNKLLIEDCKNNDGISIRKTSFTLISIRNCPTKKIDATKAKGIKLQISNMLIGKAKFKEIVVQELILHDVSINEDANFENALAEESLLTNFSIKKGSKVNMNGTNIKFQ